MQRLVVQGKHILSGTIPIGGAKNDVVALIPAAILCDNQVIIDNVPEISDINALSEMLTFLGAKYYRENNRIIINTENVVNKEIPENIASKLRASYYFMGSLLGKYKKVEISLPGGCKIGRRPIDLHLKGFEALGAKVYQNGNKLTIIAEELKGADIHLDFPSVGATINLMLAATKADGVTTINNAAKEPEIVNAALFLNNMGARIRGAGTNTIVVKGVETLNGCTHEVIPDRIEAGTYLILGALTGEQIKVTNIIPEHLEALIIKLKSIGAELKIEENAITIMGGKSYKAVDIHTGVYPAFPTDLQQPFLTLLTQCHGRSIIEESIYESRFQNVTYLNEMGAKIKVTNDNKATVEGPTKLYGEEVVATDLRAGACLLLAALIAEGETHIIDIEHILRGYEKIIEKLTDVGAKIEIREYN